MRLKIRFFNKFKISSGNKINIATTARIRKCKFSVSGTGNSINIEEGAILSGTLFEIKGDNCIIDIGKNTIIGGGSYLSVKEESKSLVVGSECNLSRNVTILCADGHDILIDGQRINPAKNIVVGNGVWLADGVVVLKGVTIGDGSVAGINAVITKDVPAGCIAVGNPAKIVQEGVTNRWEHTWRVKL